MEWPLGENEFDGEVLDLFDVYCNGTASAEELSELEQLLMTDSQAMNDFVVYTDLHARLQRWARRASHTAAILQAGPVQSWDAADQSSLGRAASGPMNLPKSSGPPILGFLAGACQAGGDFLSRSFVFTLVLALGLPGIVLLVLAIDVSHQPVATAPVECKPVIVAEISQQDGCVWDTTSGSLTVGTRLVSGQTLGLRAGLVNITYDCGATVILEGPSRFEVGPGGDGFLRTGRLVARVKHGARGFVVRTPTSTVVDLGTEFGVSVAEDGASESHVFEGEVEVTAKTRSNDPSPPRRRLQCGQAVRVSSTGRGQPPQIGLIAAAPAHFVREMPSATSVCFAHRGDADPTTEGWVLPINQQSGVNVDEFVLAPINDNGTPAWVIRDESLNGSILYAIKATEGLTPDVQAQAASKGWVLRARIKVNGKGSVKKGMCHLSYLCGERIWRLRPAMGQAGEQCLVLVGESSLGRDAVVPIPGSRGQYVDYEIRYRPKTNDAEVYVNGRRVASQYHGLAKEEGTEVAEKGVLHFGSVSKRMFEMRVAMIEWRILGED